jgi:hypothetical protein
MHVFAMHVTSDEPRKALVMPNPVLQQTAGTCWLSGLENEGLKVDAERRWDTLRSARAAT